MKVWAARLLGAWVAMSAVAGHAQLSGPRTAPPSRGRGALRAHSTLCVLPTTTPQSPAGERRGRLVARIADRHGELDILRQETLPVEGCVPLRVGEGGRLHVPADRVLVRFEDGFGPDNFEMAPLEQLGRWSLVRVAGDPMAAVSRLRHRRGIAAIEADLGVAMESYGPDPHEPQQWHLPLIAADRAWSITRGRPGLAVAVIDHAVDAGHEDLRGCSIAPAYDAVLGRPFAGPDTTGHGTACAGLIAAASDNGIGVRGLCSRCSLVPIHIALGDDIALVNDRDSPQLSRILYDSHIARAFAHARDMGAEVISNSWGPSVGHGPYVLAGVAHDAIHDAATRGRNGRGIVVVFAAGNGGGPVAHDGFATHADTITVGAVDAAGRHAPYSNWGDAIDLVAPSGVDPEGPFDAPMGLWTTDSSGPLGAHVPLGLGEEFGDARGHYTARFSGTSASAPLVAGAAALVLSIDRSLTAAEVRDLLVRTADRDLPGMSARGHDLRLGHGRLNVGEAAVVALAERSALSPGDACTEECGSSAMRCLDGVCAPSCGSGIPCADGMRCETGWCRMPTCESAPSEPPEDACLTPVSRCEGDLLIECDGHGSVHTDCAALGGRCTANGAGGFGCDLDCEAPALVERPWGVCGGTALLWCSEGAGPSASRLRVHGCHGTCVEPSGDSGDVATCRCVEGESWCDGDSLVRCQDGAPRPIPCASACVSAGDFAYCECAGEADRCEGQTAVYCGRDGRSRRYECLEDCSVDGGEVDCSCSDPSSLDRCVDDASLRFCVGGRTVEFTCPAGCETTAEGVGACRQPALGEIDGGTGLPAGDGGAGEPAFRTLTGSGCGASGSRAPEGPLGWCILVLLARGAGGGRRRPRRTSG